MLQSIDTIIDTINESRTITDNKKQKTNLKMFILIIQDFIYDIAN